MASTSDLLGWLTSLPPHALADVVASREEVLAGSPVRDFDDLAERLAAPSSVAAVLASYPTPVAQVLETLVACGAGASVRRAADLLRSSGDGADHLEAVKACVTDLTQAALVWPAADESTAPAAERILGADTPLEVNPGVTALVPAPWGLGRPFESIAGLIAADALKKVLRAWGQPVPTRKADLVRDVARILADPGAVRRVLADAPAGQAEVLIAQAARTARNFARVTPIAAREEDVAEDEPVRGFDRAAYRTQQGALAWARDHGLAYTYYGGGWSTSEVEFPSEVVLALLPPDVLFPFRPTPPPAGTAPVTADQVRAAASATVTDTLSLTMSILEALDRTPLPPLKAGGIGAREIARAAKQAGSDPAAVRLALELGSRLHLLENARPGLGTSPAFREWRRREPAERAADLTLTWLTFEGVPTQDRSDDDKAQPALVHAWTPRASALRGLLLAETGLLEGAGVLSPEAFADFAEWRLPYLAWGRFREDALATWDEAHRLGVLGLGAMTEAGRAVIEAASSRSPATAHGRLVEALRAMLPATRSTALFGSDLTVIVPGSPAPEVVDLLDTVAAREARGSAATWRISPESVRRALDEGHDADDLLRRLRALSESGLPQALEYLVRDVARRHGHVGVQAASAVVVGEDAALLAEVAAHRSLRRLGLRQVAPTVLVAQVNQDEVLHGLRAAGYLPVPLDAAGVRIVPRPAGTDAAPAGSNRGRDAAAPALRLLVNPSPMAEPPPPEDPADVVTRLLRGVAPAVSSDEAALAAEIGKVARRLTGSQVQQLAHAIATGGAVTIRYRASSGGVTERVISEMALVGGFVYAWCHLRQAERYFALASMLSVTAA